ncbi:hypothetical protein Ferp_1699 [Ferroglobus placidus DSM 10642]|uniref:Uncharacterized protein n=1 Tax=Ferroglobus placidus (strain DSM 10642 / AEDII12DO) TaxID=589924 RepID=D3RZD0_FERPA|nr:TasA family protein [Ferroglobus placidus]ADC65843.1 hypothetical protein Ferp_1699 [Ferroglobus placidus DSM 10642]
MSNLKIFLFLFLLSSLVVYLIPNVLSAYALPIDEKEKEKAVKFCFETGETPPPFLQASNFAPGNVAEGTLKIANCGEKKSKRFGLSLSYSFFDPKGDSEAESFLSNITLIELKIGKENDLLYRNLLSEVEDLNGNGVKDLHDLSLSPVSVKYKVEPCGEESCEYHYLYIRVKFDESAGNEFQGDRVELNFTLMLG